MQLKNIVDILQKTKRNHVTIFKVFFPLGQIQKCYTVLTAKTSVIRQFAVHILLQPEPYGVSAVTFTTTHEGLILTAQAYDQR